MSPVREEARALRRLAVPIVLTNVGTMAMGLVDTLMVGRLNDAQDLAAVALAGVWLHGTTLFAMGLVFGIDPIVTQAHGARNPRRLALALHRGFVIALLASVVLMGLWGWTGDFLSAARDVLPTSGGAAGFSPATVARAHEYAIVQVWSAAPFLLFIALKQHLQGRGIVRPALVVILVCNLVNVVANDVLIFGGMGVPALGLRGAGIATAVTRAAMLVTMAALTWRFRLLRGARAAWSRASVSLRGLGEVLRFGVPTAFQMAFEVWAFGAATLMAGRLGDLEASAHHIALSMASMTFMVPMGVSFAAATRVGNLIGAGRQERARTAGWVALALGAGTMGVAALFFIVARTWLPSLYFGDLDDPEVRAVIGLCSTILPIAAAFQVFDGTQVVGCGILRGMGRTLPAAVINLVGYWVLALPLAWWMTFELGMGLRGIWWGIATGLAIVAATLLAYLRWRGPAYAARA